MKYLIDLNSKEKAYMQIYRQFRDDIVNCAYKYGDKLPSKRILAEETNCSVITIEHAYAILCDEGYVQSRQRSGYFVTYKESDFVPVIQELPDLSIAPGYYNHTDDEFPFSVYAKTMRNVISKYGDKLLIKSPNLGCEELKKAISNYLARSKGISVSPNQVVIGSGAEYLYGLIVQFLGRDKIYALEKPSYDKILSVYKANGASCDLLKLGKDGIVSEELENTNANVLHITPYRSYPSGVTASASKRNEYIKWAIKRNAIVIEDDFDSEVTVSMKHIDTVFSLEPMDHVVYINTFTKTIAPSVRVGYMVLPQNLVDTFQNKLGFYSCTVPIFEQYVLAELINNGDFERHINRMRRKRRKIK